MSELIEKVLPPTTDISKSQGVKSVTTKAEEMDYCYTVADKIFQRSLGKNANFSNARYMGDYSMTLEEAQTAKCKYVAEMLGLRPGKRVMDLGSGWGGWLRYVKDVVGAEGVGVTLSQGQVKHSQETGLEVHLMDMRTVTPETFGCFDAVTAFGSFEHLCSYEEYLEGKQMDIYRIFFKQVKELIPVGRRFYMQTMTFGRRIKDVPRDTWDINAPKGSDEYTMALMVKMFPLSWIPYLDEPVIETAKPYFKLIEHSSGRLDYVKTDEEWAKRYKKFDLIKLGYYIKLLPKYIIDKEFRYMLDMLRYSPNRRTFERELFDHFRYVFERVE